jgi:hypothetical protein
LTPEWITWLPLLLSPHEKGSIQSLRMQCPDTSTCSCWPLCQILLWGHISISTGTISPGFSSSSLRWALRVEDRCTPASAGLTTNRASRECSRSDSIPALAQFRRSVTLQSPLDQAWSTSSTICISRSTQGSRPSAGQASVKHPSDHRHGGICLKAECAKVLSPRR